MGSSSPALSNMQFLVLLSAVALAFASPIPEEGMEAPEALAYVHDATGDVAVDDSPAALPYVHDATGDVADASSPEAEAYVHDATGDVCRALRPPGARPRCCRTCRHLRRLPLHLRRLPLPGRCCRCSRHLRRLPICWIPLRRGCLPHRLCQQRWQRCALRLNAFSKLRPKDRRRTAKDRGRLENENWILEDNV